MNSDPAQTAAAGTDPRRLPLSLTAQPMAQFTSMREAPSAPNRALMQLAALLGRQAARKQPLHRGRGFSLLEVALPLIIAAVLLAGAMILLH